MKKSYSIVSNSMRAIVGCGKSSAPIYMQIEPTNRCNFKCKMCARQSINPSNKDMSYGAYTSLVDQMKSVKYLMLSGFGEPLLHPAFIKMVSYAKGGGMKVETITNGSLITKEYAEMIVKSGLDTIFISMHTTSPKIYKNITGSEYLRVLKGLESVVWAKKRLKSKTPRVVINSVVMKSNLNKLRGLVWLVGKYGNRVVDVNFKSQTTYGFGVGKGLKIDFDADILAELKDIGRIADVNVNFSVKDSNNRNCWRIWFGGFIDCDGELYPCCNFYNAPKMGNVFRDGLDECWNSWGFVKFRKSHVNRDLSDYNDYVRDTCEKCNLTFNDKFNRIGKWFR